MLASAIREMAASTSSPLIAAAFFEKVVQIWDVSSLARISEFPVAFCMGAANLAIAPLGNILITGLSERSGKVIAYESMTGVEMWQQEFEYPSSLRFDTFGQTILCTINQRSILRLNAHTGDVIQTIKGTTKYFEGPLGDALRVPSDDEKPIEFLCEGHAFRVVVDEPRRAILDAQFSPDSVCFSTAGGNVRCISRADGKQLWVFAPEAGTHVLRLHYSAALDAFFAILWSFQLGGARTLLRFNRENGAYQQICDYESWEDVFVSNADQLLTSAGEIRILAAGAVAGRLAFPQREYP